MKPLNSKESKKFLESLNDQFGIKDFNPDLIFFKKKDGKVFVMSKDLKKLKQTVPRINSLGLYFAAIHNHGVRLSFEGSQIVGPFANKAVLEINKSQLKDWFNGFDLKNIKGKKGFVILKYNSDFVGCGYLKEDTVLNYIAKNRRVTDLF